MSRKEEVLKVFQNKESSLIPFAFWFHFTFQGIDQVPGDPVFLNQTIERHKAYYKNTDAGIYKLMTEGYFNPPNLTEVDIRNPETLASLKPLDLEHPWVQEQVAFTKALAEQAGDDAVVIYTLFSPISYLAYRNIRKGFDKVTKDSEFAQAIDQYPEEFLHGMEVISDDVARLGRLLIQEGNADGIFLSVRNYHGIEKETYRKFLAPGEKRILEAAADVGSHSILHVCGYTGAYKNDFSYYEDYSYEVLNWAVHSEELSLREGKDKFPGKAVLGGFDNREQSLLAVGTKEEIQSFTKELVKEAGRQGLILGADCSLPMNFSQERILWVKEALANL